jgi:Lrp/AsnC family transcriptional regulator
MLDDTDRRLLRQMQADPTAPISELAERCRMQPATAARRLDKLARQDVLKGQHAVIDWVKMGYAVEVSLRFTLDKTQSSAFDDFLTQARDIPEVIAIQTFLGRVDVRLSDVDECGAIGGGVGPCAGAKPACDVAADQTAARGRHSGGAAR